MPRKYNCRFINLAEQLAIQNDVVNSTMDSIVEKVVDGSKSEERSDWYEIKKTLETLREINRPSASNEGGQNTVPKPKLSAKPHVAKIDTA